MTSLLISAESLARQLAEPETEWRIVDCRSQLQNPAWGRQQYLAGHIPGAVFADLERELSGPIRPGKTGRHPLPAPDQLASFFARIGIGPQTTVVAYDDAGGTYASRLWWLLRWLGHDHCQLLDGGLPAWLAAGQTLQAGEVAVRPQPFVGVLQTGMTIEAGALLVPEHAHTLIDVRTPARYAGQEEPIDPVAGHIPGAINLPYSGNLAGDGSFLDAEQLQARYRDFNHPICYCGSGVTACHSIFAMAIAGLPARLYPGSWSEWITDPARPIARLP